MAQLKESTGYKTLDRELQKDKYEGIIESFDKNSDGYWLYLEGYNYAGGSHIVHDYTVTGLIKSLQDIQKCDCMRCNGDQPVWSDKRIHKIN